MGKKSLIFKKKKKKEAWVISKTHHKSSNLQRGQSQWRVKTSEYSRQEDECRKEMSTEGQNSSLRKKKKRHNRQTTKRACRGEAKECVAKKNGKRTQRWDKKMKKKSYIFKKFL